MGARRLSIEDRKALLLAQGELDRLKIAISCRALRDTVMPHESTYREEKKGVVGLTLRVLLLVLGATRIKRLQRGASLGLVAWRLYRFWNKGRQ